MVEVEKGDYVCLSDTIENFGYEFEARLSNGVVDYVVVNLESGHRDLTQLFDEPYIVDRFKAFLEAVQKHER